LVGGYAEVRKVRRGCRLIRRFASFEALAKVERSRNLGIGHFPIPFSKSIRLRGILGAKLAPAANMRHLQKGSSAKFAGLICAFRGAGENCQQKPNRGEKAAFANLVPSRIARNGPWAAFIAPALSLPLKRKVA
jgi:hypothetical protein